jgi:hypothetical protein
MHLRLSRRDPRLGRHLSKNFRAITGGLQRTQAASAWGFVVIRELNRHAGHSGGPRRIGIGADAVPRSPNDSGVGP